MTASEQRGLVVLEEFGLPHPVDRGILGFELLAAHTVDLRIRGTRIPRDHRPHSRFPALRQPLSRRGGIARIGIGTGARRQDAVKPALGHFERKDEPQASVEGGKLPGGQSLHALREQGDQS
jgi:hypothetical protein